MKCFKFIFTSMTENLWHCQLHNTMDCGLTLIFELGRWKYNERLCRIFWAVHFLFLFLFTFSLFISNYTKCFSSFWTFLWVFCFFRVLFFIVFTMKSLFAFSFVPEITLFRTDAIREKNSGRKNGRNQLDLYENTLTRNSRIRQAEYNRNTKT